jgi:hypothetical protein
MPPAEERQNCTLGQIVKLSFINQHDAPSERMWVEIVELLADGQYRGRLRNTPDFIKLDPIGEVEFGPEHILEIWPETFGPLSDP